MEATRACIEAETKAALGPVHEFTLCASCGRERSGDRRGEAARHFLRRSAATMFTCYREHREHREHHEHHDHR
jgi:hypothetical protein